MYSTVIKYHRHLRTSEVFFLLVFVVIVVVLFFVAVVVVCLFVCCFSFASVLQNQLLYIYRAFQNISQKTGLQIVFLS